MEVDPAKRMGHTWTSFIDNPFFRTIDFEALERKEIEPVFIPSSDKTNFDATYDLEELLLEEAPLEARTRKQKKREPLAEGASEKEVREDELYKMIESGFKPFDYTLAAYNRYVSTIRTDVDRTNSDAGSVSRKEMAQAAPPTSAIISTVHKHPAVQAPARAPPATQSTCAHPAAPSHRLPPR